MPDTKTIHKNGKMWLLYKGEDKECSKGRAAAYWWMGNKLNPNNNRSTYAGYLKRKWKKKEEENDIKE